MTRRRAIWRLRTALLWPGVAVIALIAATGWSCDGNDDAACPDNVNDFTDVRVTVVAPSPDTFRMRFQSDRACADTEFLLFPEGGKRDPGGSDPPTVASMIRAGAYVIVGSTTGSAFDVAFDVPAELSLTNARKARVGANTTMIGLRRGTSMVGIPLTVQPGP